MKNTEFFETIKNNSLLSYVFDYDPSSLEDIECYVKQFEDMPGESIANNTQWLYRGDGRLTVMLGLYQDNIIAISEDFDLFRFCDYFQDIPYEIYRRHFGIYESDRKEHVHKLKEYEQWCRDNNIVVDPNHYYHDENKDIFKEYFEFENYYDQDIITRNL